MTMSAKARRRAASAGSQDVDDADNAPRTVAIKTGRSKSKSRRGS